VFVLAWLFWRVLLAQFLLLFDDLAHNHWTPFAFLDIFIEIYHTLNVNLFKVTDQMINRRFFKVDALKVYLFYKLSWIAINIMKIIRHSKRIINLRWGWIHKLGKLKMNLLEKILLYRKWQGSTSKRGLRLGNLWAFLNMFESPESFESFGEDIFHLGKSDHRHLRADHVISFVVFLKSHKKILDTSLILSSIYFLPPNPTLL